MARPKTAIATPAELRVLHHLWDHGPAVVRDLLKVTPDRAYTSVMSLCNVLHLKGLATRTAVGRAYLYKAAVTREAMQKQALKELLTTVFNGDKAALKAAVAAL